MEYYLYRQLMTVFSTGDIFWMQSIRSGIIFGKHLLTELITYFTDKEQSKLDLKKLPTIND